MSFRKLVIPFVIFSCTLSACANLPTKVISELTKTADTAAPVETPSADGGSEGDMLKRPENQVPGEGPTVTAIVMVPSERGAAQVDFSDLIMRETTPDTELAAGKAVTAFPTAAPVSGTGLEDKMSVQSFNPASGATLLPGQSFHLDVLLRNEGTTVWQTSYKVIEYSNMQMSADKTYSMPMAVAPGGTVLISIYMTAPSSMGSYNANFMVQDAYGVTFGYFDFVVTVGEYSVATGIATLTPTVTPTYYSAEGITATPDTLAWMCIDMNRSKLQDCYSFCVEYPDKFPECYYDGVRYETPEPMY